MAPLPKKKNTKARSARRTRALTSALAGLSPCPSCKRLRPMHAACPFCGYYKG